MRLLHATHGVHFADLSTQYAAEHPDGVWFQYDAEATQKAVSKSPTGIAARVYAFSTELDDLADKLLEFEDEYGVEEKVIKKAKDETNKADPDAPVDPAPVDPAPAKPAAAASGAKGRGRARAGA